MRMMTTRFGHRIAALAAVPSAAVTLLVFAVGTAHADLGAFTPTPSAMPTTIAGCNELPLSQRGLCRSQVGWSQVTPSAVAIDRQASAATASEMGRCKTLPLSDRYICEDQAGYGQNVPRGLSGNQRIALGKADARFHAAVAACNGMPLSDRTICQSQAGYDVTLATG